MPAMSELCCSLKVFSWDLSWREAAGPAMGPSFPVLQWAEAFAHPESFACPIATEMSEDCKCLTSATR